MKIHEIKCRQCGEYVMAVSPETKFCSPKCSSDFRIEEEKRKKIEKARKKDVEQIMKESF